MVIEVAQPSEDVEPGSGNSVIWPPTDSLPMVAGRELFA
jgi:hypothetical protein